MITLLSLFNTGCSFGGGDIPKIGEFPKALRPAEPEPKQINVDVYWDASESMKGYAVIEQSNFYRTLPDTLGDLCSSMGNARFFRFGEQVIQLEGREHRKFSNPEYYTEVLTEMHKVIDVAEQKHVSIIITDLFESDADWSNLTEKLKKKYFSQHMSVAIIGIKNPFRGKIFDVGMSGETYNYDSGNERELYRPFYMLIAGPDAQVREMMFKWRDMCGEDALMEYAFFSEGLMQKVADLSTMEFDTKNLVLNDSLGIKDKRIKEFEVDSHGKPTEISAKFKYEPTLGSMEIDINKLKTKAQLFIWNKENSNWDEKDTDDIQCELISTDDGMQELKIIFIPETVLPPKSIGYLAVSAFPLRNALQNPNWVKNWSMSNIDVSPDTFDGTKTINFQKIVESMKLAVLSEARPVVADMSLIIITR